MFGKLRALADGGLPEREDEEMALSATLHMKRALELARRAEGFTHPNPMVGCVLVKGGEVIAEGWHKKPGAEHAEAMALRLAGTAAKGATAYVTLEPCNHFGRTPPCSQALIKAGVEKVIYGASDQNPLAEGGATTLRAAGISAELINDADIQALCTDLIRPWAHAVQSDRPWVTAKVAMSFDGFTATASGESKWITGEEARQHSHQLRQRTGAIAVGIGTVLADDPSLDPRPSDSDAAPSLKVIFDSQLQTPHTAKLLTSPGPSLALAHEHAASDKAERLREAGADVVLLPGNGGRPDLSQALRHLKDRGIVDLVIEGGSTLLGEALTLGIVDEIWAYRAPLLLGAGNPAFGAYTASSLASAPRLELLEQCMLGDDQFSRYLVKRTAS